MTSTQPAHQSSRPTALLLAACYFAFVVYGSLVPLDYHPRSLEAAWRDFLATRYLVLGIESRADWVANILLYMPLAYLFCAAFAAGAGSAGGRLARVCVVFVACAATALGVEFAQLFFPPRTVSLNDIVAEFIGSGLGIGIWLSGGSALERLWTQMIRGGQPAVRAIVVVYVLAYAALSLFPYDFVVSAQEFSAKLAGGGYGLIVAPGTCEPLSFCAAKLLAEMVAVVPLGVLLGMALGNGSRRVYAIALFSGLALGLTIEAAQLFIESGITQGLSILTRAAGVTLGVALLRHARWQWLSGLQPHVVPALLVASPAYLLGLMSANGWFSAGWAGIGHARASLHEVYWLPFYYHYFTTETLAVRSALSVFAVYLPVGLGYWIWTLRRSHTHSDGFALVPALIAAPLAIVMETGKLFVPGKHPDPTDALIAAFAAAASFLVAAQLQKWAFQGVASGPAALPEAPRNARTGPVVSTSSPRVLSAILLLCGAGIAIWNYPLGGAWLALALGLYAAVLWRRPGMCLPAVVALLPLLNLAPWSGWILLNEFDLLIAVTLAVRLLQPPPDTAGPRMHAGARLAIGLLAASFFASAVVGLLPLSPFDQNALFSYHSSFSSLMHLKGFAWALALLPLLIGEMRNIERMDQRLAAGMLAGLCGVVAVAVWERAAFAGLFDFAGEYRVEGTFPELHTGGGDIHVYLVMSIPFVAAWISLRPTAARIAGGTALFALASYVLAVTFTRGGYIGYCGAMGVLGVAAAVHWFRQRTWQAGRVAVFAVLALASLAIVIPIASGPFMEARLATSQTDGATRTAHWSRAIDMMDADLTTALFGMGLGSFPRVFLVKDLAAASATFSYGLEGGNGFVRLGSGRALYLDQRVSAEAGRTYTLSLDLRSADRNAGVGAQLCEKSLQYSFRCKPVDFRVKAVGTRWENHKVTLDSGEVGSGPLLLRRPVVVSLANTTPGTIVEVDNVRLLDERGRDLVSNGDFSRGGARWFFSADDHLPWHIFNLWVQVLFEQGWFGVLALAVAVVMPLARLALGTWRGELSSAILLAALCGFLLTGLTESLFDGPRVTTLFFLLLFAAAAMPLPSRAPDSKRTVRVRRA